MPINVKMKGQDIIFYIKELTPAIKAAIKDEMYDQNDTLANYIIEHHMTGSASDTVLGTRSGFLKKSTRALDVTETLGKIKGGVGFGVHYGVVHFVDKGKITTIKPKGHPYLAIPIGPALTAAGVAKKSGPREWTGLSFMRRKAGKNPLLIMSGIPYYVLVKEVSIKARIHPIDILNANKDRIADGFGKAIGRAIKT